ncbi:MAG: hypothetical protein MUP55_02825 [Candidatus Aenigmarchaeota archaeon]|nr:hypothetical protein [Candidatus Aenigmarchaeota archaeon]
MFWGDKLNMDRKKDREEKTLEEIFKAVRKYRRNSNSISNDDSDNEPYPAGLISVPADIYGSFENEEEPKEYSPKNKKKY